MAVMKMKSVTIDVSIIPRTVDITALSLEDNQQYTYSGSTRRASKRLQDLLGMVAAAYQGDDDFLELNVSTDGSLTILPGP
jgi:hypothetical protein